MQPGRRADPLSGCGLSERLRRGRASSRRRRRARRQHQPAAASRFSRSAAATDSVGRAARSAAAGTTRLPAVLRVLRTQLRVLPPTPFQPKTGHGHVRPSPWGWSFTRNQFPRNLKWLKTFIFIERTACVRPTCPIPLHPNLTRMITSMITHTYIQSLMNVNAC